MRIPSGAKEGDTVKAFSNVIHSAKTTMVAEGGITDGVGKLLAKARGTFFIIGHYTENDPLPSAAAKAASSRKPENV